MIRFPQFISKKKKGERNEADAIQARRAYEAPNFPTVLKCPSKLWDLQFASVFHDTMSVLIQVEKLISKHQRTVDKNLLPCRI